jgi:GH24 family phage-related lysozyme (muramidase)
MRYINKFNEDEICDQIILNLSINEGISDIWNKTVSKIANFSEKNKKRVIKSLIAYLLTITTIDRVHEIINSKPDNDNKKIATYILKEKSPIKDDKFKSVTDLKISQTGIEHIKSHETLKLKAYKIGDGKISMGWGHAEDSNKSLYDVGDSISVEKAEKLFDLDVKRTEDGIKRIFKEWKEPPKLTQSMYDALVSIAYNTGIGGLRKSQAILHLKKKEYIKAGKSIKGLRVSKKFPGLSSRRNKESEMFLAGII